MKILIIGITGMLGRSIYRQLIQYDNYEIIGIARKNADYNIDITNYSLLIKFLKIIKPDVIINTAAIVSLDYCEQNPVAAYLLNTKVCNYLADFSSKYNAYYVQISTDHYYSGDGGKKHLEKDRIELLNEYARTKYLGECLASLSDNSIIIRTNIVGFRKREYNTFLEWTIDSFINKNKMTLFNDFFTSSMHTRQLAAILCSILQLRPVGIFNIASSEVVDKKSFVLKLADKLNFTNVNYTIGSLKCIDSKVKRANSLGLDVNKIESLLNVKMPNLEQVIDSIVREYKECI